MRLPYNGRRKENAEPASALDGLRRGERPTSNVECRQDRIRSSKIAQRFSAGIVGNPKSLVPQGRKSSFVLTGLDKAKVAIVPALKRWAMIRGGKKCRNGERGGSNIEGRGKERVGRPVRLPKLRHGRRCACPTMEGGKKTPNPPPPWTGYAVASAQHPMSNADRIGFVLRK